MNCCGINVSLLLAQIKNMNAAADEIYALYQSEYL
jgi:hypothetical protein